MGVAFKAIKEKSGSKKSNAKKIKKNRARLNDLPVADGAAGLDDGAHAEGEMLSLQKGGMQETES